MDAKSITATGKEHHPMKSFDITPGADGHTFFLGEADVIARLLFHPAKDFFFAPSNANDNSTRRLDVMRGGFKFQVPGVRSLVIPSIWFNLEENRAMPS